MGDSSEQRVCPELQSKRRSACKKKLITIVAGEGLGDGTQPIVSGSQKGCGNGWTGDNRKRKPIFKVEEWMGGAIMYCKKENKSNHLGGRKAAGEGNGEGDPQGGKWGVLLDRVQQRVPQKMLGGKTCRGGGETSGWGGCSRTNAERPGKPPRPREGDVRERGKRKHTWECQPKGKNLMGVATWK